MQAIGEAAVQQSPSKICLFNPFTRTSVLANCTTYFMKTVFRFSTLIFLKVLFLADSFAQDTVTTNFLDQIKNYNLATVLAADSILTEDRESGYDKIKRAEILGFIGDDYQRFYIHLISVIQNPTNPYEYLVYGKTKIKETVRSFQGTINIRQSRIRKSSDIPIYQQGFAICDILFFEDKSQPSTGYINGRLTTNFIIDNKGEFRYDAIMFVADGFTNNQFVGSWTSYKTNISKKCHWGDYRIPDSGDLDIGAGEFGVADKYVKNGWENHRLATFGDPDNPKSKMARQKEAEQWWK